mgnify:CR=1 FL=1
MTKTLTQKILEKFGYTKKGVGPFPEDASFHRSLRSYLASVDNMEVVDPYKNSVWVFASINAIAQNISRVPFYIYTEKKKDIKSIVTSGPLYELFTNPNPYMITSTLFFATVLYLELYGESFWVMDRNNIAEVPENIWVVNPSRFEPVVETDAKGKKIFRGYWEYTGAPQEKITLAPHQILQFRYFDPYNELRGASGYEPSKIGVEQDYFASRYNKQFFKDGISLSGLIKVPDFLTDEQFARMKNQFEQKHGGYSNSHKVGIIEGGADFVETRAMSQRDMEFSILKDTIRGEILAAFKTNEVVLGNYSNIQCFHPDTEIMTDKGFVNVSNIRVGDLVASYNPETGLMEYQPTSETFVYDYKGEAYRQKRTENGKAIPSFTDYFVTPEHKMFGKERKIKSNAGKYKTEDFIFKRIKDLDPSVDFCSIKNGEWSGEIIDYFDIEKRTYERKDYKNGSKQGYKETSFPIVTWLKFLGWFISEGCFKSDVTFELSITQVKEVGRNKLIEDLKDFPYKIRQHGKEFVLSGKDLFNYLMDNVGHYCHEKRIPREVLNLHPTLLKHLFESLMDGDGTKQGKVHIYTTTSRGLADDVYELALRLGYSPTLEGGVDGIVHVEGRFPNARPFWKVYVPSIQSSKKMVVIKPEKVEYEGKIYCVAVPPYHTLLTRYNGKTLIISNSYEGIKQAHESFWKETLLPKIIYLEDYLWAKFFSNIQGGKDWGGFDTSVIEALREDFSKKVEMAKVLNEIGYPINAINKRLDMGFEEVPWGNTWWVRMGTIPVENAEDAVTPSQDVPPTDEEPITEPEDEPVPDEDDEPATEPLPDKGVDFTMREDSLWGNFIARELSIEQMFKGKLKRFLFEQRKRVLSNVYEDKAGIFDAEFEIKELHNVITNTYKIAAQAGVQLLNEEIATESSVVTDEVNKFVSQRIDFSVKTIITTIEKGLNKLIADTPKRELADKIRTFYNKTDNRLTTIARTEACSIINGVRFYEMGLRGVKHHKWISKSENGRHNKFAGKIVKLGESFSDDFTIRYPLDSKAPIQEVINCKCYAIPVIQIKEVH